MSDCVCLVGGIQRVMGKYILTLIVLVIMCVIREFILYIGKWYELKTLHPHKLRLISNKFWITNKDVKLFTNEILLNDNDITAMDATATATATPIKTIKCFKKKIIQKKHNDHDSNPLTSPFK